MLQLVSHNVYQSLIYRKLKEDLSSFIYFFESNRRFLMYYLFSFITKCCALFLLHI
jgi:hypothetical protein